jgi:hypothetical protein
VITVGGEAVSPAGDGSGEDEAAKEVRAARLELRLCKALAALNPPRDVALLVHARAAGLLRLLRKHDAADTDVTAVSDLGDGELREAVEIVRAFRALPPGGIRGFPGGRSFRAVLGEYAFDLAAELDSRARGSSGPLVR